MAKKSGSKSLSSAFNAQSAAKRKAKDSARQLNPFEVRDNKKLKHDALNRRVKGASRNVALSRAVSNEKRKRLLMNDYRESQKANAFVDKRFGEKDKNMSEEEKILERFKKLRSKRNLYDLSDTDKNLKKPKVQLTHLGQSLTEGGDKDMKEFERMMRDEGLNDDDIEERIDATELMEKIKSAGNNEDRSKSKKEVMEELIAKAKLFKMQRQREKEEMEDERERLDDAYRELVSGGAFDMRPTKRQQKDEEMKAMLARLENKDGTPAPVPEPEKEQDDFEALVRSLHFEARAAASDRTMTPEEKAKREREKLEEQQRDLERRKLGIDSDDEEWNNSGKLSKKKKKKAKDAFFDTESVNDEEQEEESTSDSESAEEEDDDDEEIVAKLEKIRKEKASSKKRSRDDDLLRRAQVIEDAKRQLPFVLDAPQTHVEFVELLEKFDCPSFGEVVNRIRRANSIHLLAENRQKLREFLDVLIQHLVLLVEQLAADECEDTSRAKEDIQQCMSSIYDVAQDAPENAVIVFMNRLERMEINLLANLSLASQYGENAGGDYGSLLAKVSRAGEMHKRKKGGHKGSKGRARVAQEKEQEEYELEVLGGVLSSPARCWPSPGDFAFFRVLAGVFPVTDFEHPVISPAQLLLSQYLSQCPIRGPQDVVASLCTCQVMLDFVKDAKRFAPEVILTLEGFTMQAFLPFQGKLSRDDESKVLLSNQKKSYHSAPALAHLSRKHFPAPEFEWLRRGVLGLLSNPDECEVEPGSLSMTFLTYSDDQENKPIVDSKLCNQVVFSLCSLIEQTALTVADTSCCDLILGATCDELRDAKEKALESVTNFSSPLLARLSAVVSVLERHIQATQMRRGPMRLLEETTQSIKLYDPIYNENYRWTKDGHDKDRERTELRKLKREQKRERKGVARELRKDAQFLAEQRDIEKQKRVVELRSERQRNFNLLTQQSGEFDKAVRVYGAKGAGSTGVNMRGRRKAN